MSGFGTKQQWHNSYGSKNSKKSPKINKFQEWNTPMWVSNHWGKGTNPY